MIFWVPAKKEIAVTQRGDNKKKYEVSLALYICSREKWEVWKNMGQVQNKWKNELFHESVCIALWSSAQF